MNNLYWVRLMEILKRTNWPARYEKYFDEQHKTNNLFYIRTFRSSNFIRNDITVSCECSIYCIICARHDWKVWVFLLVHRKSWNRMKFTPREDCEWVSRSREIKIKSDQNEEKQKIEVHQTQHLGERTRNSDSRKLRRSSIFLS